MLTITGQSVKVFPSQVKINEKTAFLDNEGKIFFEI